MKNKLIVALAVFAMLFTNAVLAQSVDFSNPNLKSVTVRMKVTVPYLNQYGNPHENKSNKNPNGLPNLLAVTYSTPETGSQQFTSATNYWKIPESCRSILSCYVDVTIASEIFSLTLRSATLSRGAVDLHKGMICDFSKGRCEKDGFIAEDFEIINMSFKGSKK